MNAALKLDPKARCQIARETDRAHRRAVSHPDDTPRDALDRELLRQHLGGHPYALQRFFDAHAEWRVQWYEKKGIVSPADHDDLHQSVAERFLQKLPRYNPDGKAPPVRRLRAITKWVIKGWTRDERRRGMVDHEPPDVASLDLSPAALVERAQDEAREARRERAWAAQTRARQRSGVTLGEAARVKPLRRSG